jgi:hypothetical protein
VQEKPNSQIWPKAFEELRNQEKMKVMNPNQVVVARDAIDFSSYQLIDL